MSSNSLPNDLYEVLAVNAKQVIDCDPAELDFVCRDIATEMTARVMEHFQDVFERQVDELRRRDEKIAYEKDARRRAEKHASEARAIIEAAGNTPPHEWAAWEAKAAAWLGG